VGGLNMEQTMLLGEIKKVIHIRVKLLIIVTSIPHLILPVMEFRAKIITTTCTKYLINGSALMITLRVRNKAGGRRMMYWQKRMNYIQVVRVDISV
jgi:hypothetical protein